MTKKHFIAMAAMFKTQLLALDELNSPERIKAYQAFFEMIHSFCIFAKSQNSLFDAGKFKDACGIDGYKS